MQSRNDWLTQFARFNEHFGRFIRDALGVLCIAIALMTLLALGGYTEGLVLTPWADLISLWFGWGAYLVALGFGYAGISFLRRAGTPLGWGRLFALELAAFLTLGLLAGMGGNSLLRAEAGADGGRIGWGIATLFGRMGQYWGTLLNFLLWLLALMTGLGIWAMIERWLLRVAGETPPLETAIQPELVKEPKVGTPARSRAILLRFL
jgi:S-DNA-T family DNA segregation ATPase FtsK/SpoIIIE